MPRNTFALKPSKNYVTRNVPEKFRDFSSWTEWAPDRTLGTNRFKNLTKGSWQENQNFKENDKTFKFIRHVSTETSVIFSLLMYKALEVEFISREKCQLFW